MNCEKCGTPMIIDEWGGWVWMCYHCDHVGRTATNEEVERQEKEFYNDGRTIKMEGERR